MPKTLLPSALPQIPRGLLNTLITDRTRGRMPTVESYERPDVDDWLCYVGVDWDALVRHVDLLKKWLPDSFGDPLKPEVIAAVRDRGPAALTDPAAVAGLLLNPNQLIQLHEAAYGDGPDGAGPSDFWVGVIDRVAKLSALAVPSGQALAAGAGAVAHKLLAMTSATGLKLGQSARVLGLGLDAEGEALKAEIIAQCYGTADLDEPFGLTLHAEATSDDADKVRLYLTVTPAPVKNPLELTLTFEKLEGALTVTLVIPAYSDGRREASSVSSDPVPRAAFEFAEGQWTNQLPLRLTVRGDAPPAGSASSQLVRDPSPSAAFPLLD